LTGSQ